jgi:hypothetical protein
MIQYDWMKEGELYRVVIPGGLPMDTGNIAQGEVIMCLGHGLGLNVRFLTRFGVSQREIPLALMGHWLQRLK